jgi:hypothetical protein
MSSPVQQWFLTSYKDTGLGTDVRIKFKTLWTKYDRLHTGITRGAFEKRLLDFLPERIVKDCSNVKWVWGIAVNED